MTDNYFGPVKDELANLELPVPIMWQERHEHEDTESGEVKIEEEVFLGFGTEHVAEMLPAAVQDFRDDGPELYDVRALVAVLTAKNKRLERKVADLEKAVAV